ncbi:DNA polymerase III subunit alpha [Methylovirgula sp. 4M-Z18]|uniref:DNA polymerase III subunit alpha n=1 Tax=Methylovirgula sp. 4M-Z18 TaxID=2293567 RepID=UPI000E2EB471|nr:DNA polymerase III subunit alpha [Methylovirgula sp. 4M-Z18]RFB81505.1 DNA polymerase III subunit alpha [Methylovirgula sp. 4M-Z18]
MLQDVGFVHLHVHSSFSLREGALTIAKLAKFAKADAMPALAITDTNNLFGGLEFSEKISKEGIQPIVGIQLTLEFGDAEALGSRLLRGDAGRGSVVLLAATAAGYANLMRIGSRAWLDPSAGDTPHVRLDRLDDISGLIALSGGPGGPLDRALSAERPEVALARLQKLQEIFGDRLYVELQRHGLENEKLNEGQLLDFAYGNGLPLVATNESFFAAASDYEAHDALICIAEGTVVGDPNRRQLSPEHRLKSRAEMVQLFADLPEATANTIEIAMRCAYRPRTGKPILPRFTSEDGTPVDEVGELCAQAEKGLKKRLAASPPAPGFSVEDYEKRLAFELDVIIRMKFPGYFLIVSDFIKWAKAHDIPVGPGRGSGAGSLVAYALTITDLDPMRFGLLFERFLNPERISMPDFDIDFCQYRRDEVIAYVRERYGRDRVAQIITFGSFLARGVMRNVGRVLEMPLGQVDRLAKLVPQNPANPISLADAIKSEVKLREAADEEPRVAKMLAIAGTLEGLYSNASTHAAGIVIGDRPLDEIVPLYQDPKSDMPATQFNMKWVEPAGLVKFDFLGLKTLTTLATTVQLLKKRGIDIDLTALPLDDQKTFDMLGRGETIGVFQVESAGMRKALVEMRADRLEDLIALVALYRPGPMANIPVYCAVKHGDQAPDYIHPKIEPVLKETFGVIIYQEQVMQIAQILSGYSLGEADMLRRAMGKKIKAEMDAQRARFVDGAMKGGLEKAKADEIFDLLAKFADYGFNKSHAAAYALIAYQTAWFKANYPVEFLAASMTLDKSNTDKLSEFRNEARRLGIKVEPPSVNKSGVDFEVHQGADGALNIRYALSAVKGAGEGQVGSLVSARGAQPFDSLGDFARRINPREVNKKVLESLAAAGAFDDLESDRARAFAAVEPILSLANLTQEEAQAGQSALFGEVEAEAPLLVPHVSPWPAADKLARELDAIGFFLSGHPLDDYASVLTRLRVTRWANFARDVKARGAGVAQLAATVLDRQERRTKSGSKMGIVNLSDQTGQYEAILFQEGLNQYRDLLEKGRALLITVEARVEGEDVRARITAAEPLDQAASRVQKGLRIFVRDSGPIASIHERLKAREGRAEGEVSLVLMLEKEKNEVEVKLPGKYVVSPQVAGALKAVPGIVAVEHL